ncbi:hypothetical protein ACEZCY_14460 [Streptacidiphilus sp. N1-12]|uniref:Uncharacterized protein n=2 Tax=Streptacidiphilus alkalitolerans TaxID=3342712 RepID=A0ABV6WEG6_9ACTN
MPLLARRESTARHRRPKTSENWDRLAEDLDSADHENQLLQQAAAEALAAVQAARDELAYELWIRDLQDHLIGRLVQQRDHARSQAQSLYTELGKSMESNGRCVEVIVGLRQQLSGVRPPAPPAPAPVVGDVSVLQPAEAGADCDREG